MFIFLILTTPSHVQAWLGDDPSVDDANQELHGRVAALKRENSDLITQVRTLESDVALLESDVAQLERRNKRYEADLIKRRGYVHCQQCRAVYFDEDDDVRDPNLCPDCLYGIFKRSDSKV